jgi:hypothetical protein
MRVVVDTNVFVSAALKEKSPPGTAAHLAAESHLLLKSTITEQELFVTLARPRLTLDDAAWGAASEVVPKFISPSDPAAQWTGVHKGHALFACADNVLIGLKAAINVDVEPTRVGRPAEVGAAKTMLDRTQARFGLKPQRLSTDKAYEAAESLAWMVEEKNIAPHAPVWDKSERTGGTFSRSHFIFDAGSNTYTCPGGKIRRQYAGRSPSRGPA